MTDHLKEEIIPIKEGLVSGKNLNEICLLGSKCSQCGEVSIGANIVCLNCGCDEINNIEFSKTAKLWTYTIVRHKPPGEYLGPEPFEPFALGLVELPEGLRIMAPLEGDIDSFRIGSELVLMPWILRDSDGKKYRAFRFSSVQV